MAFLCNRHRQQVLQQPATAISHWDHWMHYGSRYFDQQHWQQAVNLLGCCHDVGEWLLEQPAEPEPDHHQLSHVDRYMVAGHLLSEALGRNQQTALELHYLLTIHLTLLNRLKTKQQQYWLLKDNLEISLAMLKRYHQQHGQFKGYHDCYLETRLCIDQCIN